MSESGTDMHSSRDWAAKAAADRVEALSDGPRAVVGFDGFIDSIIRLVGRRRSMETQDFERIATISEFAARVGSAAGRSSNIEMVVDEERFGGNGPLMAGALGRLGARVTYIGAVGGESDPSSLHPLFEPLRERCEAVHPIAPPGYTDALEFVDGKVMLGKPQNVQSVTWERLKETVGLDRLVSLIDVADVLGVVNWVMLGGVEGIWSGLCEEVFPRLSERERGVFIDLCDPAKRTDEDIGRAMGMLRRMDEQVPVTLGLNLAEAQRISAVCGAEAFDDRHNYSMGEAVRASAVAIRERLGLHRVVVHPREGAGAADRSGRSAWFEGPFTSEPRLSTGAGDHFNGGFAFAQASGLALEECLAVGCGVSGAYVRDAQTPDRARLVGFLRDLPPPDRGPGRG